MLQGGANFHQHLPLLHALCFAQVGPPSVSREQMAARLPKQHPQDTRTHTRLFILEDGLLTNSISERGWHFTSYAQKPAPQVSWSFRERLKCAGKRVGNFIDLQSHPRVMPRVGVIPQRILKIYRVNVHQNYTTNRTSVGCLALQSSLPRA